MQHRQDLVLIDALECDHVDLDRQPGRPRRRQPLQHRPDVAVPRYMRETFGVQAVQADIDAPDARIRSEEHTSELQSLMRISYAVFCLKKKNQNTLSTLSHQPSAL